MEQLKQNIALFLKKSNRILKDLIKFLNDVSCEIDFKTGCMDFVPRSDDIFIVTYPRSGTTIMQMILHQITTDGNIDFEHIYQFSPWFERFLSFDIMSINDFDKLPSPRIFKSHLSYEQIPKGPCKYIYVARNGKDVVHSYYHLYKSHLGFKGDFSEFFIRFMQGKLLFGSWFKHVAGWW